MSTAARNNAEWCDAMCRAHGWSGAFDRRAWTSPRRTPPLYPDAVTLTASTTAEEVLDRVDRGPGCSVKDSFARLDLTADGFHPIVEAVWLRRAPRLSVNAAPPDAWSPVHDAERLRDWEAAWDGGHTGLFPAALLAEHAVQVMAAEHDGRIVGGAVLNRGRGVTGVSNLFAVDGDLDRAWAGLLRALGWADLVTYESPGPGLGAAVRNGWLVTGPLRVWLRPGPG
jgi:hypothetical protein